MKPSEWIRQIDNSAGHAAAIENDIDHGAVSSRLRYKNLFSAFRDRFGDVDVRVFRAPGRINLRGMHVDTHGGYLNLLTHQRDLVVLAAQTSPDEFVIANTDTQYPEAHFTLSEDTRSDAFQQSWNTFIGNESTKRSVLARSGSWENYLRGCALRLYRADPRACLCGVNALVSSELPRGEALSSSAALCVAFTLALAALNDHELNPVDWMRYARDAEWYAGARCGLSDQAAIVLGCAGRLLNLAMQEDICPVYSEMPRKACVVVIKSFTTRSLSGKGRVAYTRNRFSYSMALGIARQELLRLGISATTVQSLTRLPDFSPEALASFGGLSLVLEMLKAVPVELRCDEIKSRYDAPFPNFTSRL